MATYGLNFAEREGFEPPVPLGTPVFKTGVIDHSTIFPKISVAGLKISDTRLLASRLCPLISFAGAKLQRSFKSCKKNVFFLIFECNFVSC